MQAQELAAKNRAAVPEASPVVESFDEYMQHMPEKGSKRKRSSNPKKCAFTGSCVEAKSCCLDCCWVKAYKGHRGIRHWGDHVIGS